MNDDTKTPVTVGGRTVRATLPYVSPPYKFAMIGDAQAIAIADDILANPLVPLELRQLCEWAKRRADVPKPLPTGVRVAQLGDPKPAISDLELRDKARAAAGLPLCGRANEPDEPDERSTWRDLDADDLTVVADMDNV